MVRDGGVITVAMPLVKVGVQKCMTSDSFERSHPRAQKCGNVATCPRFILISNSDSHMPHLHTVLTKVYHANMTDI
jgi:hypothetical protein